LYGKPVIVTHGDLLCTLDTKYQLYRKVIHNKIVQTLYLALPLALRRRIAGYLQTKSRQHYLTNATVTIADRQHIFDVVPEATLELLQRLQADTVIHGHTHKPEIHKLNATQTRVTLGAWHEYAYVLKYTESHGLGLEKLG
jgi:UDP-2,3-diacylglucosamine hydrolase